MKVHVEISHLTTFDAFRINRDQVIAFETGFKIHTNDFLLGQRPGPQNNDVTQSVL